jgi:hypothetical protein
VKLDLYQRVALCRDVPEYQLQRGDIVTLIDYVPHPSGGEDGCVIEVFNVMSESIMVAVVPASAVEPLRADEIMAVRPLAQVV